MKPRRVKRMSPTTAVKIVPLHSYESKKNINNRLKRTEHLRKKVVKFSDMCLQDQIESIEAMKNE
jgi:hypothetical protein